MSFSCTWKDTFYITQDGLLMSKINYDNKSMYQSFEKKRDQKEFYISISRKPMLCSSGIFGGAKCISINSGSSITPHSAVITDDFSLWTFGSAFAGQLGHNKFINNYYCTGPMKIDFLPCYGQVKIKMAACGFSHTIALSTNGKVFCCGSGSLGQLGNGIVNESSPIQVTSQMKMVMREQGDDTDKFSNDVMCMISAKANNNMCLSESGDVFAWGSNSSKQLGINIPLQDQVMTNGPFESMYPIKCINKSDDKVVYIANGCSHAGVVCESGKVFMWGSNFYGQLGHGDTELRWIPTIVESTNLFISISCARKYTLSLDKHGIAYVTGYVTHMQFENKNHFSTSFQKIESKSPYRNVSIFAEENGTCITKEDGSITSWGHHSNVCNSKICQDMTPLDLHCDQENCRQRSLDKYKFGIYSKLNIEKKIAIAMATHNRLGSLSCMHTLEMELLIIICKMSSSTPITIPFSIDSQDSGVKRLLGGYFMKY